MNGIKLLLLFCMYGCSFLQQAELPISAKMYECVKTLVGVHGVPAPKATEACKSIYGRND